MQSIHDRTNINTIYYDVIFSRLDLKVCFKGSFYGFIVHFDDVFWIFTKVLCLLGGFGVKWETYYFKIFETSDKSMITGR